MHNCDCVVIGSGFGGAVSALRLSEAGLKVIVLERGRRWAGKNLLKQAPQLRRDAEPFPELGEAKFFWGRNVWRPWKRRLGLFEVRQMTNLQGLTGAGVGGGSLIWANVVIEAPEHIFDADWPKDITRAELEKYYRRAEPFLSPKFVPGTPGVLSQKKRRNRRAEALKDAAQKLGKPWRPVRVAVNFDDASKAQSNGHGKAMQMGCDFTSCGKCSSGCTQNAKNSVDLTYLARAESLGAEVWARHEVVRIEAIAAANADGTSSAKYRVHYRRYREDGAVESADFIEAGKVIVSAGTFGSTELLLKAKANGDLPNLSDALGTKFSINGNVLGGAVKPGVAAVDSEPGPQIASMVEFSKNVVVEDFANPSWTEGIVGAGQVTRLTSFLRALLGFPKKSKGLPKDLLVYVGVGKDSARGRLKLNALGQLCLSWPGGLRNEPVIKDLHEAMTQLASAQNRKYVPDVFSTFGRAFTYHPLGGCPMGASSENGVVDSYGRVFGYDGLYIADGSIVPTAIGRNPAFTISALAERIAQQIAGEEGRTDTRVAGGEATKSGCCH